MIGRLCVSLLILGLRLSDFFLSDCHVLSVILIRTAADLNFVYCLYKLSTRFWRTTLMANEHVGLKFYLIVVFERNESFEFLLRHCGFCHLRLCLDNFITDGTKRYW